MFQRFELTEWERPNVIGVGLLEDEPAGAAVAPDAEEVESGHAPAIGVGGLRGDARRKSAEEDEDFEDEEFGDDEDEAEDEEGLDDEFEDDELEEDDLDDDLDEDADEDEDL
jgi:hypothetical protein